VYLITASASEQLDTPRSILAKRWSLWHLFSNLCLEYDDNLIAFSAHPGRCRVFPWFRRRPLHATTFTIHYTLSFKYSRLWNVPWSSWDYKYIHKCNLHLPRTPRCRLTLTPSLETIYFPLLFENVDTFYDGISAFYCKRVKEGKPHLFIYIMPGSTLVYSVLKRSGNLS
jgi:hypothetical protein